MTTTLSPGMHTGREAPHTIQYNTYTHTYNTGIHTRHTCRQGRQIGKCGSHSYIQYTHTHTHTYIVTHTGIQTRAARRHIHTHNASNTYIHKHIHTLYTYSHTIHTCIQYIHTVRQAWHTYHNTGIHTHILATHPHIHTHLHTCIYTRSDIAQECLRGDIRILVNIQHTSRIASAATKGALCTTHNTYDASCTHQQTIIMGKPCGRQVGFGIVACQPLLLLSTGWVHNPHASTLPAFF